MKPGDLVKHPQGIVNVSAEMYSLGLILESTPGVIAGQPVVQHLVWWCSEVHGPMAYLEESLEVINESR